MGSRWNRLDQVNQDENCKEAKVDESGATWSPVPKSSVIYSARVIGGFPNSKLSSNFYIRVVGISSEKAGPRMDGFGSLGGCSLHPPLSARLNGPR
jgi:hypothetical protein